jgi:hypothetical protein
MPFTIDKCLSGLAVNSDVLCSVMIFTCLSNFPPSAYIFNIINVCLNDFQCRISYSYLTCAASCQFELNRMNFVSCFNKNQDMVHILYSNHVRYKTHQTFIMNPEKV